MCSIQHFRAFRDGYSVIDLPSCYDACSSTTQSSLIQSKDGFSVVNFARSSGADLGTVHHKAVQDECFVVDSAKLSPFLFGSLHNSKMQDGCPVVDSATPS